MHAGPLRCLLLRQPLSLQRHFLLAAGLPLVLPGPAVVATADELHALSRGEAPPPVLGSAAAAALPGLHSVLQRPSVPPTVLSKWRATGWVALKAAMMVDINCGAQAALEGTDDKQVSLTLRLLSCR